MPETVDVHFDFRSPYAYFAAVRIARGDAILPPGVTWRCQPVSINVLLNLQAGREPTAPYADPLAPAKRQYVFEDVRHCGAHYGIPFMLPNPLRPNTVPAMAAFELLEADIDAQRRFLPAVFDAIWRQQKDVGDPRMLAEIAKGADVDVAVIDRALTHEAQNDLIARSARLYETVGVFGVPTFIWNKERFFGVDRLDMVCAAVAKARAAA